MRNPPRMPSGKDSREEASGVLCMARHPGGNRTHVEIKTSTFPNGELITYLMTPESVRGAYCTLVAREPASSEEIVTVLFALQLLRDYGARHIEVVVNVPSQQSGNAAFLVDLLGVFADVRIASGDTNESVPWCSDDGVKSAPHQPRPTARVATGPGADLVLCTPSTRQFLRSEDGSALIDIDTGGAIRLPDAVTRGQSLLLVHSTDRGAGLVHLFEILFELRNRDARLSILVPRFAYARQHKPYVVHHRNPETGEVEKWYSANSVNAILTALARYASQLYTINVHFAKEPGWIDLSEQFSDVQGLEAYNLNAFPEIAEFYRRNRQLVRPIIIAPDKGAIRFAETTAQAAGMDFGGHIEKTRDSSLPAGSQVKMTLPDIELAGRDVILIDDIISSGETIIKAAVLLKKQQARHVLVGCVEGEFTAPEGVGVFGDESVLGRNIDELTNAGLLSETDKESLLSRPIIDDLVSTDIIFNETTSKVSIGNLIERVASECRCM